MEHLVQVDEVEIRYQRTGRQGGEIRSEYLHRDSGSYGELEVDEAPAVAVRTRSAGACVARFGRNLLFHWLAPPGRDPQSKCNQDQLPLFLDPSYTFDGAPVPVV